jgi:hypothetical protein
MAIGAGAFVVAFLLVAVQRSGDSYWAFTFPALAIVVVGTDLEFNVVNVSHSYQRRKLGTGTISDWLSIYRCTW